MALCFRKFFVQPIYGLVMGVLVGGVAQVVIHLPILKKHHLSPRFDFQKHPALEKMSKLFWPSCYGAAIYQFHVLLITALATFLPAGSVSWLWYADRLFQFPLGLVTIAMATVLLPTLSIQAQSIATLEGRQKLKETLSFSMKTTLALIIPATLGLIVLAKPIVKLLFEHGQFGPNDVIGTQKVLIMTAIGLPFVSISKLLSQVFLSLQQPKILLKASNLSVALHILFSVILIKPLASQGLALALSLSAIGHAGELGYRLKTSFKSI
ncbi:MAG: oligosaccharide flippase family protein [Deltaproteobacteria bacterium]|nr:MAG: oligosaccharide flippase family protein [Deltaproteobacteria bacterium]